MNDLIYTKVIIHWKKNQLGRNFIPFWLLWNVSVISWLDDPSIPGYCWWNSKVFNKWPVLVKILSISQYHMVLLYYIFFSNLLEQEKKTVESKLLKE